MTPLSSLSQRPGMGAPCCRLCSGNWPSKGQRAAPARRTSHHPRPVARSAGGLPAAPSSQPIPEPPTPAPTPASRPHPDPPPPPPHTPCSLLSKLDFADMKFSLYFLGYAKPEEVPEDPGEGGRAPGLDAALAALAAPPLAPLTCERPLPCHAHGRPRTHLHTPACSGAVSLDDGPAGLPGAVSMPARLPAACATHPACPCTISCGSDLLSRSMLENASKAHGCWLPRQEERLPLPCRWPCPAAPTTGAQRVTQSSRGTAMATQTRAEATVGAGCCVSLI